MANFDPEREAHKSWLGLLQPVGLVVSPPALVKAQAVLDKHVVPLQQALLACVERPTSAMLDGDPVLRDFPRFAREVLGWQVEDLAGAPGGPDLAPELTVSLPDYHDTLRPTYAVLDAFGQPGSARPSPGIDTMSDGKVLMLVVVVDNGTDLDAAPTEAATGWHASPQARLERLLRDTSVSAGLLLNGRELRLVYAPRGESSGHVGFPIAEMCSVGGRQILAALHMLLSEHRVFGAPNGQRLLDLLRESRKHQSEVSNDLAEQVLGALWELLRGFQAADEAARGRVLFDLAHTDPNHIYGGVLTVIMRLVFLLYAEDRGLLPDDPVYANNYAVAGLYERLREDAGRYPDTMDQRYGAWAWLLSTFRLVFDGGGHAGLHLPTRHGQLFNPDEYPFLEGRPRTVLRVMGETFEAPKVSDGVIWRVLEGLLMLDGERLSYRTLDVEQIGSVYESMMGFEVETTHGQAIAVRPKHVVFDVDALLAEPAGRRLAWLKDKAECELTGQAATALKEATTAEDVVAALGRKVSPTTPRLLPPGALFLQPGEERRRSGSHYTPRELTEPIVRTTLRPILEAPGQKATPDQILDLKVCDPAMGSGAFLVEACRQLAEALVTAWDLHRQTPKLPADEDPLLHARRLIAQRCLYGVDKNPFAVNLAKLSLWLVTLARDHAFTFLDHALKHGDSLVGLTKEQIGAFHWAPPQRDLGPLFKGITTSVNDANAWRTRLFGFDEGDYTNKRAAWKEAEDDLAAVRLVGDACVAAYFSADKDKDRDRNRLAIRHEVDEWRAGQSDGQALRERVAELRGGARPIPPFHWEIEFPEVFERGSPGFDAIVGNPPFAGKNTIAAGSREGFMDWLKAVHLGAHGNSDLVAHFFRRGFVLLRHGGAMGLIATKTIAEGDTRETGLLALRSQGGVIFCATKQAPWPGAANVAYAVVHVAKPPLSVSFEPILNGKRVSRITAYLLPTGDDGSPRSLASNAGICFEGVKVGGRGFHFDDSDAEASSIADMEALVSTEPRYAARIKQFFGGEEITDSPILAARRFVIDLTGLEEVDAERDFPRLMSIIRSRVRPDRDRQNDQSARNRWWQFFRPRPELLSKLGCVSRVLVCSKISKWPGFIWGPRHAIYSHNTAVFLDERDAFFATIHSSPHEIWTKHTASTIETRHGYRPSDCFETFPFPKNWTSDPTLEAAGKTYYEFRADLMVRNDEGLTKTYNRFHDPDEHDPDILKLRELHAAMDRAVLDAYGWTDIPTDCEFLLDYEIDEATWGNKKKPWRYRWPEAVHDEVLVRLLDLNQKRHLEEQAAGPKEQGGKPKAAKKGAKKPAKKATAKAAPPASTAAASKPSPPTGLPLFDHDRSDS